MKLAVGVDLGGTNARAALVDVERGAIIGDEAKHPLGDRAPDAVAALLEELARAVDPRGERLGVGVGIAAMLRGWSGVVVNAPNLGWREVDFRARLRGRVGARAELYNDLNAIAFGEATYGAARGVRDVLFVFVGTGVGAGLVLDGELYIGATHLAGEFGHTKVVAPDAPGARQCGCGQRGCLEAYASGRNIQTRVREELRALIAAGQPQPTLALQLAGGALEHVHAGHLDEAARLGDAYANRLWDEVARYLGIALANAVTMLNPSRLIMGGGVWQGAPELGRRALREFDAAVNAPSREGFSIVESALGDLAGVLGAAALIADSPRSR
ncbi:MAG TPA: ROK family protein [Polyangia bacterium]|nr:ROK family protein [Polyangia bacterium]